MLDGEIPDRVPCIPLVYYFAATYAGVPYRDFTRSMAAYRRAMTRCFEEVGPWDAMYPLPVTMDAPRYEIVWGAGVGLKPADSDGSDDETQTFQFTESGGLIKAEDYERIAGFSSRLPELPYLSFLELLVARTADRKPGFRFWTGYLLPQIARFGARWAAEVTRWRLKRVPFFPGFSLEAPFDTFSMARGIEDFSVDIFRRGDELEAAVMKLARSYAAIAKHVCRVIRIPNFLLLVHRSSNDFISPAHYKRFCHPGIKLIADELANDGIVMAMHCDGDWTLNFEHMTDLPPNTVLQLDGFSDIRHARAVLGDRLTLMGDVRPDLLSFGEPSEVEAYCTELIRDVGSDGHFILSSGCEVPPNAKVENVRAMIRAAAHS